MDAKRKRALESAFYNYKANERQANESLIEISSLGLIANYSGITVCGSQANKLEELLTKHADRQLLAMRWFRVADNTIIKYKDEYKYKIIECFYFKRLGVYGTMIKLNIDRATLFRWKREILSTAEFWAQQYHLL